VRGALRVHVTLSDDAAVDDVLEQARPGLAKDVTIVDHSTTSPGGTRERALRWAERGVSFQHAPVFMGPKNALDATGVMLASGERARFEALEPALAKMTGKLLYLGEQPERAAAFKLLGNSFLMFLTAGLADFFTLAKGMNIPAKEASELFSYFNPGLTLPTRIDRMLGADFAHPSWELAMARKDARLMLEEAERAGLTLAVLPAIAKTMDAFIERGHGHDDWTVIAKDAL
jgi:3-hydroxyisobutyrate dehydrogenase